MSNTTKALDAFLIRIAPGNEPECFQMWFCRGPGKCELGSKKRAKLSKQNKHCPDCTQGNDEETLEQVAIRIRRGDA